ncbi:hypothetical protein EV715DRAFT_297970 [Schizophyllum commune]
MPSQTGRARVFPNCHVEISPLDFWRPPLSPRVIKRFNILFRTVFCGHTAGKRVNGLGKRVDAPRRYPTNTLLPPSIPRPALIISDFLSTEPSCLSHIRAPRRRHALYNAARAKFSARAIFRAFAHAPADPPVNNIDPALLLSSQQRARRRIQGYEMPAFDVDDDNDDEDSTGHPRRHPDHPLPWPSLTAFAGHALAEPIPTHFGWSTGCSSSRPSPRPTIVSDPAGACKIDARTVLNVGDTAPLTSTSSPALLCFDTDVRALQRSRVRSTPFPPPAVVPNHAAATIPLNDHLLDDASDASDVTQLDALNALDSPLAPMLSRASNIGGNPLDDVADAFDVVLLDELDAALIVALALCVAALIECRWVRRTRRDSSSATTRQHVGDG